MTTLKILLNPQTEVTIAGDDAKEAIEEASFWCSLPTACPVCRSAVRLGHRNRKGFDFYFLRCDGTGMHESTFGQHKEGGSLFYKESEPWQSSPRAEHEDAGGYGEEPPSNGHAPQAAQHVPPQAPPAAPVDKRTLPVTQKTKDAIYAKGLELGYVPSEVDKAVLDTYGVLYPTLGSLFQSDAETFAQEMKGWTAKDMSTPGGNLYDDVNAVGTAAKTKGTTKGQNAHSGR